MDRKLKFVLMRSAFYRGVDFSRFLKLHTSSGLKRKSSSRLQRLQNFLTLV